MGNAKSFYLCRNMNTKFALHFNDKISKKKILGLHAVNLSVYSVY